VSTAIVTGGSAGIGRAVAVRLLDAGYEVLSLDVQPTDLPKVKHVQVDLTDTAATARPPPRGSPQVERVIQGIPVKRLGQPDDVARAVLFFADREAGFVTGQVLYVCGGTSVGSLRL
jgi:NAD(P)-dependent dehydrogenase (short-subunit alcohol dehydrogenase family)